jgi:hypothetical protein
MLAFAFSSGLYNGATYYIDYFSKYFFNEETTKNNLIKWSNLEKFLWKNKKEIITMKIYKISKRIID